MTSFSQTLNDKIMAELARLCAFFSSGQYSKEQRESFSQASIEHIKIYCSQLFALVKYIESEGSQRQAITMESNGISLILPSKDRLVWTESKVDFIELAYALKIKGSFNHGHASVSQIAQQLGHFFSIDPGNTSKKFQDIRARKMGAVFYIQQLASGLLRNIDDDS